MVEEGSVLFEVDSELYAIPERQATSLAEDLRVRAARGGDEAYSLDGAVEVADEIEARLVGERLDRILLEEDHAEAVYYSLDTSISNPEGDIHRLYLAVRRLHRALEEL